eukprot:CAMPEP_0174251246 /NCGR_PEP_ID=MMETSP0439-20130205/1131_1 /TAXON_ID=0 /ORGANISM="Stereomyxa ramosa, Strain Chinc5" /LENGTH=56 /DNA_ID=CAMNT_0015331513 /DNA_START=138 /DNA_END=308 /DNA_ORIENTATION=-
MAKKPTTRAATSSVRLQNEAILRLATQATAVPIISTTCLDLQDEKEEAEEDDIDGC